MGRKKIVIEPIPNLNKRYVAFSKRKDGLFNKAKTASLMYGSTIGIFVFSPTLGKLHSFGPVDSLIDQLLLHQSSSNSLNPPPPPPPPHLNSTTTTTTSTEGKKRSRRSEEEDDDQLQTKKRRKLLMMSTTTTTTEAAAAASATEEEEEEEEEEEATVADHPTPTAAANYSELDDELNEYLNGFADEIIAGHDQNWSTYN